MPFTFTSVNSFVIIGQIDHMTFEGGWLGDLL